MYPLNLDVVHRVLALHFQVKILFKIYLMKYHAFLKRKVYQSYLYLNISHHLQLKYYMSKMGGRMWFVGS